MATADPVRSFADHPARFVTRFLNGDDDTQAPKADSH
jgi:hypothetical protein